MVVSDIPERWVPTLKISKRRIFPERANVISTFSPGKKTGNAFLDRYYLSYKNG
jgi:hypothetical protein